MIKKIVQANRRHTGAEIQDSIIKATGLVPPNSEQVRAMRDKVGGKPWATLPAIFIRLQRRGYTPDEILTFAPLRSDRKIKGCAVNTLKFQLRSLAATRIDPILKPNSKATRKDRVAVKFLERGYKVSEVAETLNWNEAGVRNALRRASYRLATKYGCDKDDKKALRARFEENRRTNSILADNGEWVEFKKPEHIKLRAWIAQQARIIGDRKTK
ncbi:MAG: hypothetical protein KTR14_01535 [Vampirovibrio sp.]|nr:hypothetical protein [Vampirovibrio sp.]